MTPLTLGANTFSYIYTHSMLESLRRLKTLGYQHFEILVAQPHLWPADVSPHDRKEIPAILEGEGLKIVSVNLPGIDNNIVSSTREMREFSVKVMGELVDLCGLWGIPYCIIVPGRTMPLWPIPHEQLTAWFVDGMTKLADRASGQGVTMLIENVPNTWIPRAEDVMAALDALGRDDVGIIYDCANAPFAGEDPVEGVRVVAPRLKLVHLSDTPKSAWRHDPIGTGDIDFAAFHTALRDIDYRGYSMAEIIAREPDRHFADAMTRLTGYGWAGPV
ncbi:MAG: sugar phosphate isomerase/epimerase family protein [Pseudomonadota bacterium]